jgi:hypothetical protein
MANYRLVMERLVVEIRSVDYSSILFIFSALQSLSEASTYLAVVV